MLPDSVDLGPEHVPFVLFGGLSASFLLGLWSWAAVRRKPGFAARHTGSAAATWAVVAAVFLLRGDLDPARRWAHGFADAGLLLIAASLAVGPLARLWRPATRALQWRRELGLWGVFAAAAHVALVYDSRLGWSDRIDWSLPGTAAATGPAVHAGDIVGIVAAAYAVVLALLSNDLAQRRLRRGWSWIMGRATTLHLLVLLHAWIFARMVYDMPLPTTVLVAVTAATVLALQTLGFLRTVRGTTRRAPSVPASTRPTSEAVLRQVPDRTPDTSPDTPSAIRPAFGTQPGVGPTSARPPSRPARTPRAAP